MHRHLLATTLVACLLTFGGVQLWSGVRAEFNDQEQVDSADTVATPKKSDRGLTRVFKAPFVAIKKLFGGGKSDDKVRRMTEKDASRFETAALTRIEDSRSPAARPTGANELTAREHLAQGRALLTGGQLNQAIAELSLSTSLDPQLSQAHSLLAVAYEQKGLKERAKESHKRALGVARDNGAQALNNAGYSLYLKGDYRGAVEYLKRAAKLAPTDERTLNNLGLAQCRLGKYEEAFKSFARAGGEFTGRMNTAAILERGGMQVEAIKHYEAARRLQPSSPVVLGRLAQLYQRTGRNADAEHARQTLGNFEGKISLTSSKGN